MSWGGTPSTVPQVPCLLLVCRTESHSLHASPRGEQDAGSAGSLPWGTPLLFCWCQRLGLSSHGGAGSRGSTSPDGRTRWTGAASANFPMTGRKAGAHRQTGRQSLRCRDRLTGGRRHRADWSPGHPAAAPDVSSQTRRHRPARCRPWSASSQPPRRTPPQAVSQG